MKRLLQIEWTKLYNYKSARIFTLLYFVMLIVLAYMSTKFVPPYKDFSFNLMDLGFFDFPYIWHNITFLMAIAKLFLAMIIILNVTNEFGNGTLKQNLIDGLTKKEFLSSKLLTNTLLAVTSSLLLLIICVILGSIFSNTNTSIWYGMEYLLAYFVKLFFILTFCTFLAILLKKSIFSILGFFVWWIAEIILLGIEYVQKNDGKQASESLTLISEYLPLNNSHNLIKAYDINIQGVLMNKSAFNYVPISYTAVIIAILYSMLFIFLSYLLLKKRDL